MRGVWGHRGAAGPRGGLTSPRRRAPRRQAVFPGRAAGARTVSEAAGAEGARLGILGTREARENKGITPSCGEKQPEASQASIRAKRWGSS